MELVLLSAVAKAHAQLVDDGNVDDDRSNRDADHGRRLFLDMRRCQLNRCVSTSSDRNQMVNLMVANRSSDGDDDDHDDRGHAHEILAENPMALSLLVVNPLAAVIHLTVNHRSAMAHYLHRFRFRRFDSLNRFGYHFHPSLVVCHSIKSKTLDRPVAVNNLRMETSTDNRLVWDKLRHCSEETSTNFSAERKMDSVGARQFSLVMAMELE